MRRRPSRSLTSGGRGGSASHSATGHAATFFLGAQQARIVRAGQIVGVPAGVPHRWVATGDSRLRAIAVHGAAEIVTSPACAGAPRRASR